MFTGIITDIGRVRAVETGGDPLYTIETRFDTARIALGASIACNGVCLTVVATGPDWFKVQVSAETLGLTTAKHWQVGSRINLEGALKVGDELGGHIVSGHVDGVGEVSRFEPVGESWLLEIEAPQALARYIARKGSVTVNGVSLTVNHVDGRRFDINIIPHTRAVTTFRSLAAGHRVNLEVDLIARYCERILQYSNAAE